MNQDRDWQSWSLPPLLGEPESPEIDDIHRAIVKREQAEPQEGLEPAPWGAAPGNDARPAAPAGCSSSWGMGRNDPAYRPR